MNTKEQYDRCFKMIETCESPGQLDSAIKYCELTFGELPEIILLNIEEKRKDFAWLQ